MPRKAVFWSMLASVFLVLIASGCRPIQPTVPRPGHLLWQQRSLLERRKTVTQIGVRTVRFNPRNHRCYSKREQSYLNAGGKLGTKQLSVCWTAKGSGGSQVFGKESFTAIYRASPQMARLSHSSQNKMTLSGRFT